MLAALVVLSKGLATRLFGRDGLMGLGLFFLWAVVHDPKGKRFVVLVCFALSLSPLIPKRGRTPTSSLRAATLGVGGDGAWPSAPTRRAAVADLYLPSMSCSSA